MSPSYAVDALGLQKRYGDVQALDGFDLAIRAGSIHGLLGPNGAGKSTGVKALTTLIELDGGRATVAGHDVRTEAPQVRRNIGLVGQSAALDEVLTGRENLVMFGRLLDLGKRDAQRRADELLETFDLTDASGRPVSTYSGGMRRRLDIAVGLILAAAVLFLDEPTTGLDPRARNEVWASIRAVAASGTTVLLTTQYLDEADQLADRISVMNHGKVVADDPPEVLKKQLGGDRVVIALADSEQLERTAAAMSGGLSSPVSIDTESRTLTVEVPSGTAALAAVVRVLDAQHVQPEDVLLRRPTLDEVFLALTDKLTDKETR
ncbi:ATP-binding cassette domain-containing protein [Saxibacter everestensis]|uniref:ATP-binding cassette domain-containing protein n=1 Tax=Saxibacter everestensis TaxID=2909229 RepID=A0ABY8QUA2_9MICO|nr:ATP-binding cassette domain-containing protein [Brevibacteriaceae bacterium ZFBP1038]